MLMALLFTRPSASGQVVPATTASARFAPPASGGGDSVSPSVTPDGRFVLFGSMANNLAVTSNNVPFLCRFPPKRNVFLRDRLNGTTTLVSVNLSGTGGGNDDSMPLDISTNGQYALFESDAGDLVPGDTNLATDVFVRDLVHNVTFLVSVAINGVSGKGKSHSSAMTPDGRYVVFSSSANNLVPGDTNGIPDVFLRDLQAGVTTLVSPGISPSVGFGGFSDAPVISPDGRYVAFVAVSYWYPVTTLVYVRDCQAGTTIVASDQARAIMGGLPFGGPPFFSGPALSDDGRFLSFGGSLSVSKPLGSIFRYALQTGETVLMATNAVIPDPYDPASQSPDLSADGRFIAFVGQPGPDPSTTAVYVWDAQTASATVASADLANAVPTNSLCDSPALDASGRFLAFSSTAPNLTTNLVTGDYHFYLRDLETGLTQLLDADTNGNAGYANSFVLTRLTPDHRYIAFDSAAENLVPQDGNRGYDVFLRDVLAQTNELISVRQAALPAQTEVIRSLGAYIPNANGRYLAVSARTGNLARNNTFSYWDVVRFDLFGGSNILANVDTNGLSAIWGSSDTPSISADGRYVAFGGVSSNLAPRGNTHENVFLRDLQAGTSVLISVATNGIDQGNAPSYYPVLSSDGRKVLFTSEASNLAPGPFGGSFNLFFRDLQSGVTKAYSTNGYIRFAATPDLKVVSVGTRSDDFTVAFSADGSAAGYVQDRLLKLDGLRIPETILASLASPYDNPVMSFSADGRFVAYSVYWALDSPTRGTNHLRNVYLYDLEAWTNCLVSHAFNSTGFGNANSDSPVISADGRFVAFESMASDLVPNDTNGVSDVFLYDQKTGSTSLLSQNFAGGFPGNGRSRQPKFSADGQTLFFRSWASDLVVNDFNLQEDVFTLKFYVADPTGLLVGQILLAPDPGRSPTITWPVEAGRTYRVQYKNSLNDPQWQILDAAVTIRDQQGSATDTTPSSGQRFYRVVAF